MCGVYSGSDASFRRIIGLATRFTSGFALRVSTQWRRSLGPGFFDCPRRKPFVQRCVVRMDVRPVFVFAGMCPFFNQATFFCF